jgi:CRISPR-associated endonuclease/helicase Cas3
VQRKLLDEPIAADERFFVIEDATGSGKTEAALILAYRLMKEFDLRGLYFALPTTATANGLKQRLRDTAKHFFDDPSEVSFALAHSKAYLSPDTCDETDSATLRANAWASNKGKAKLTAQIGVGTVDQIVLGAIRAKHNALRLFGMCRKVVIIDEVHAYDSYQRKLIESIIEFQALSGGAVILLSATLATEARASFVKAYQKALQPKIIRSPFESKAVEDSLTLQAGPYPLITIAGRTSIRELSVEAIAGLLKRYRIRYVSAQDEVTRIIREAVLRGACVGWIRNTVGDVHSAYNEVSKALDGLQCCIGMFHSRYAQADRAVIEERVLKDFGRTSTGATRACQVLIASQVIEQSLDIDFDVLITDLAPIDLLIQRAGRLQRHARDAQGHVHDGEDARGEPELIVFGPDRDIAKAGVEKDWYAKHSRGAAKVYENHGQLWLAAQVLGSELDLINAPREAIESVYSGTDWPATLEASQMYSEGLDDANKSQAAANLAKITNAFGGDGWSSEERIPTRLGEKTVEIALAKVVDGQVVPWVGSRDSLLDWARSSLNVLSSYGSKRLTYPQQIEAQLKALEQTSALRWRVCLVLEWGDGVWRGSLQTDKNSVDLNYCAIRGLSRTKAG